MTGPLAGVTVVELGVVIAAPAAAAVLADWGATVVKIEPPEGDPQRGNLNTSYFELDNRGKRSVCLNLKTDEGRAVLERLLDAADVFVTNLRTSALARLGLDWPTLSMRFPALVYAAISGYGQTGIAADKPGYDIGAFWSRSGLALSLTPAGHEPPASRPGQGDHPTGLALAGGVAAALFARERTGRGQQVTTSLLRTGIYTLGSDLISAAQGRRGVPITSRMMSNPLLAAYRAGDGVWFWLLGVQPERHWPGVVRAIGRPELAGDLRFADLRAMLEHKAELQRILDDAFAAHPMSHWVDVFEREDVWWDPLQTPEEVLTDPVVRDSGALRESSGDGGLTVASPVDFSVGRAPAPLPSMSPAPEAGADTEQVLLEFGYDWSDISDLRTRGVIP